MMKSETWTRIVLWGMRLIVGLTFIISGFVKAIDPWGTLYKFEDYMGAMHLPVFPNLLLVATFLLCGYEFVIGIFLLLGCFRRSTPVLGLLFMAVMLPLTVWIAIWNPVEDCGCFGDALVLSNSATLWKNVFLTAALIWLLKFNVKGRCLVTPALQWISLIASGVYVVAIGLGGYIYQPLMDFRPYPVGSQLVDRQDSDESGSEEGDEQEILFVYAKDGQERKFSIDDELPDESDGWEFVRRESAGDGAGADSNAQTTSASSAESDKNSGLAAERNLRIWSEDGEEDLTEDVVVESGREIILFMPTLKDVSIATTWQINSLSSWAKKNDIEMIGVAAATQREIEEWKDLSMASYPLYTADDTQIKMVVRGNPAVVYLEDGKIVWKSSLRALDTKDFLSDDASSDPASYARDDRRLLFNASGIYVALLALLVFVTLCYPSLGAILKNPLVSRGRSYKTSAKDSVSKAQE